MKNTNKIGNVRDRAKGALWGLIVGDCLGDVLQFGPPREIGNFVRDMEAGGPFNTPAGYWTDDGSMALCIIDAYNASGGKYDLTAIADTFVKWRYEGYLSSLPCAFDIGGATSRGLSNYFRDGCLKNGDEETQGNGSLMRNAPAFLIGAHENEAGYYYLVTHEVSDITHNSLAVRTQVNRLDDILDRHIFIGCKTLEEGCYCDLAKREFAHRSEVRNSGHCVNTLDSALWAFHITDSFENALVQAVNNGHDADSVGAVCGQIAGSYYGYSGIPERWLAKIKDREKLDGMIEKFLDYVLA